MQPVRVGAAKIKIRVHAVHLKFGSYRRISAWCQFQHQSRDSLVGAMD